MDMYRGPFERSSYIPFLAFHTVLSLFDIRNY